MRTLICSRAMMLRTLLLLAIGCAAAHLAHAVTEYVAMAPGGGASPCVAAGLKLCKKLLTIVICITHIIGSPHTRAALACALGAQTIAHRPTWLARF